MPVGALREASDLSSPDRKLADAPRLFRRRRLVLTGLVVWTGFVVLALWWLLRTNAGPSVWIVDQRDSLQPATAQRVQAFFKADLGLQRIYCWLLFGPYAALAAFYFPLERGHLRLNLPLNLAACAGFLAACHVLNAWISMKGANVVIVTSRNSGPLGGTNNIPMVGIAGRESGSGPLEKVETRRLFLSDSNGAFDGITVQGLQGAKEPGLTKLFRQLPPGIKPPLVPPGLINASLISGALDLLAYGALLGLAHSVHFYRRFRDRERRALFLESHFASARLNALRAQLQPHFLFNSLNAIATLLRRDPRLAEATLLSLSDLLRLALSQSERQEISLREEMNFVQRYLEIQQTRFGDRLRVEQDIEPAALDCLVPALLLQPLVENAIRHGIEPSEKSGLVRLTAQRRTSSLVLTVEDDGVGLSGSGLGSHAAKPAGPQLNTNGLAGGNGIGLANLRARLETLYGKGQALELAPRSEGGLTVRIVVPLRLVSSCETRASVNPP